MYLFKIRQMQKIEHVMLHLSVILLAPQNPLPNFQKRVLLNFYDTVMIRLGFTGHVFGGFGPGGRPLVEPYMIKKHHIICKKKSCPIKSGAFRDEESFKNISRSLNVS